MLVRFVSHVTVVFVVPFPFLILCTSLHVQNTDKSKHHSVLPTDHCASHRLLHCVLPQGKKRLGQCKCFSVPSLTSEAVDECVVLGFHPVALHHSLAYVWETLTCLCSFKVSDVKRKRPILGSTERQIQRKL